MLDVRAATRELPLSLLDSAKIYFESFIAGRYASFVFLLNINRYDDGMKLAWFATGRQLTAVETDNRQWLPVLSCLCPGVDIC